MHLTELAITNFRCLDQVFLQPSPGINFFLGVNGAGKTSVLEALFCLSRGDTDEGHLHLRMGS